MKKQIFLPLFDGFYNSMSETILEDYIDTFPEENERVSELRIEVAENFVYYFNATLGTSLEFVEIKNPKEYNTDTNKIVVNIDIDEFRKIWEEVRTPKNSVALQKVLDENCKDRSGFMVFSSYKPENWIDKEVEELDKLHGQLVLLAYCEIHEVDFDTIWNDTFYKDCLN